MEKQSVYQKAKARVEAKLGFYIHLGVYVAVNALLTAINLITSGRYSWAVWPLMGWGLALAINALRVFVFTGGPAIKEQMIEREMAKGLTEE
jgi:hypothetical protein